MPTPRKTQPSTPAQILAHKRAVKAAQQRRFVEKRGKVVKVSKVDAIALIARLDAAIAACDKSISAEAPAHLVPVIAKLRALANS